MRLTVGLFAYLEGNESELRIIYKGGDSLRCNVMSRNMAAALANTELKEPTVIISITDIDSKPVAFAENEQIKAVLCVSFSDVDRGGSGAIDKNVADRIVKFCAHWLPANNLIVHCEAGISRSAGVCAAILKWYVGTDMQIFENAYNRPNMHCYREILKAFERNFETDVKEQN